jgi:hypothetical protein
MTSVCIPGGPVTDRLNAASSAAASPAASRCSL